MSVNSTGVCQLRCSTIIRLPHGTTPQNPTRKKPANRSTIEDDAISPVFASHIILRNVLRTRVRR